MVEEILLSPLYFLNLHSLAFINVDAYILGKKAHMDRYICHIIVWLKLAVSCM